MAKQSNKLTAREVKNLSHEVGGAKKQRFPDGGGLYLLITENNSKYWRIDYRRPVSQKYNTLAVGTYPEVTLEQARLKRDEAKKMLANGIDPAEERNSIKNKQKTNLENTFQRYAAEWLKIRELENKVDSETIRKLNKDILPFIGTMPVTNLTVEQLERDVTDAIVKRGALESARRIKSIMGMVLKLPLKKRVITYNPAYDITLPQPIKTNHKAIVNEKELKELLVKIWRYCAENQRWSHLFEQLKAYL